MRVCQRDPGQMDRTRWPKPCPPLNLGLQNPTACPTAPCPSLPPNAKSFPRAKAAWSGSEQGRAPPLLFFLETRCLVDTMPWGGHEVPDGKNALLLLASALSSPLSGVPGTRSNWDSACPGGTDTQPNTTLRGHSEAGPAWPLSPSSAQRQLPSPGCLCWLLCTVRSLGRLSLEESGTPSLGPSGCCAHACRGAELPAGRGGWAHTVLCPGLPAGPRASLRAQGNVVSTLIGLGLPYLTVALTDTALPTPRVLGTCRAHPARDQGKSRLSGRPPDSLPQGVGVSFRAAGTRALPHPTQAYAMPLSSFIWFSILPADNSEPTVGPLYHPSPPPPPQKGPIGLCRCGRGWGWGGREHHPFPAPPSAQLWGPWIEGPG